MKSLRKCTKRRESVQKVEKVWKKSYKCKQRHCERESNVDCALSCYWLFIFGEKGGGGKSQSMYSIVGVKKCVNSVSKDSPFLR